MATVAANQPARDRRAVKEVVIIGGRACGTAAVAHLAGSLSHDSRITVVDPQDPDYPSVFDDVDPLLITNTSHAINSIFPDRPADFLAFLDESERSRSVPRHTVGQYTRARFAEACWKAASRGIEVRQVAARVGCVTATPCGYDLSLDGGGRMQATDVVIAVGVGEVKTRPDGMGIPPYPSTRLRRSARREALVIGQGQSAIDAALVLRSAGSRVTMCSRTGQFPAVRTRTPFNPFEGELAAGVPADFRRLVDEDCRRRGYPPFATQRAQATDPVSRLREEIRLAEDDRCPWQDAIVGIIVALMDAGLPVADDREFLWRYVTSINLPIARRLLEHIDDGHVAVADISSIDPHAFDLVVSATGFLPPPLYHRGRTLYIGGRAPDSSPVGSLSPDLRFVLSDLYGPERIWAVGPASGIRVPFANFLHTAARQASSVARQIGEDDPST
ncbi:hypothetical protein WI73_23195 [Burkholderia ubonensis]|nr:hypothetical protein WI37_20910 [Burkholderia ubonensis]KUZ97065.1 hypothetical protein WI40_16205 [Burkholderia ubonensis]KVC64154.1 hypothetical protein WI73_23195 [Burkholderia ubonensis]